MEQRTTKWYQDMDKVAKIRAEIERLKKCSESAKMEWIPAGYNQNAFAEDCRIASFNKLLFFIDSLQEEPVSVWHNMDEVPIKGEVILVQTKDTFYGVSVQKGGTTYKNKNKDRYVKWAYASDLLNLSSVERTVKNWKEEPVSEDFEEAANNALERMLDKYGLVGTGSCLEMFRLGTEWKKEHLWKPADGDDLTEIDREVIALLDNGKVVFAHRPPEYWDGKDIVTGKVTRNYVKTYGKGVWNIPDVVLWLDLDIPQL